MGAAERNGGGHSYQQGTSSAVDLSFDEVAREFAGGVSRGKALRLLGGALVGAALASVPGAAWAADEGGNSECAKFCRERFPPGRKRGRCIRAGARGKGPCFKDGGGECVSDEVTCSMPVSSSGCNCVANQCTGTVNCVCCPPGGPCPCLEADTADPCINFSQLCHIPGQPSSRFTCRMPACPP
jgi:hypothetical protein